MSLRHDYQGVHFLRLRGSFLERVKAHGELLSQEILDGPIPVLAEKNQWLIRRAPGLIRKNKLLQEFLVKAYENGLMRRLEMKMDPQIRSILKTMSESTGLSYKTCRDAYFQPEALMLLARIFLGSVFFRNLASQGLMGLPGCTSGVALKETTGSGNLLVGRNLDYPIVGPWEKHPTIAFHEPTEKGRIPHVAIGSAGVFTAGLTSMNREGLTLSAHSHLGRRASFDGSMITSIGDEIISRAKNLDQAISIAKRHRRHGNWSFVIASAKEDAAIVLEMDPSRTRIRHPENGFLSHSNYFFAPELRKTELSLAGAYAEDLVARRCQMRDSLEDKRGAFGPQDMARILGNMEDPLTGEERAYGHTVAVVTTVTSVVMEPVTQRFWVSIRNATPVGLVGPFMQIDIDSFWKDRESGRDLSQQPTIPGYQPKNPGVVKASGHFRQAYIANQMSHDDPDYLQTTLGHLQSAIKELPTDGNLFLGAGVLSLQVGEIAQAKDYFESALKLKLTPHITQVCQLYLARCLDLLGDRNEALAIYRQSRQVPDRKLARAFKAGTKRAFRPKDIERVLIDLQYPDTLSY
ncbi:hypothetical protein K2X30_15305 [bacterium]|nr:hypothetical protein [bacterium]